MHYTNCKNNEWGVGGMRWNERWGGRKKLYWIICLFVSCFYELFLPIIYMQTTYWLLVVKWPNGWNYSSTIWQPLKSTNRQWQEELGVKLIFHMFRGRPCDNHLPSSDTGDFFFFRAGKKFWTFGLATRRQVSRPDLEICCVEYSAALQDDASVGTSQSFRQRAETWPTARGAGGIWMVGRGFCAFCLFVRQ